MEQPPQRATDHDRDAAAAVVQEAHGDGRLDVSELDDRLSRIYASKTRLELRDATADLVAPGTGEPLRIHATGSSQERRGQWRVPAHIITTAAHSSVKLDFTEASVRPPEILVEADMKHGSLVLLVPRGWHVDIDDVQSVYASVKSKAATSQPGATRLRVAGQAIHSSIVVRHPRRRRWWWPWGSR